MSKPGERVWGVAREEEASVGLYLSNSPGGASPQEVRLAIRGVGSIPEKKHVVRGLQEHGYRVVDHHHVRV
eukprot:CAMPEP_0114254334 /NCGR_PEP_ID=MMETSP0058-20121206/16921_1 /TAXON_ID=36894 /ORGANISM="Pyramimonas parkeae, CCMP726" /LENGTH=70 /DNA_ID=CAMNT_0001368541 /DNA_START=724 /DNA_END=936 /DNA_ORIENTATION=-